MAVLTPCLRGDQKSDILNDEVFDTILRLCKSQVIGLCHMGGVAYDSQDSWQNLGRELHRRMCVIQSAAFLAGAAVTNDQPRGSLATEESWFRDMLHLTGSAQIKMLGQDAEPSECSRSAGVFRSSSSAFRNMAVVVTHSKPGRSCKRSATGLIRRSCVAGLPAELVEAYLDIAQGFLSSGPDAAAWRWEDAISTLGPRFVESARRHRKDGGGRQSIGDWRIPPRGEPDALTRISAFRSGPSCG